MSKTMAFRLPDGFKDRLTSLAGPGETQVSVLIRAVDCLEAQSQQGNMLNSAQESAENCSQSGENRILDLEQRLGEIERILSDLQSAPAPAKTSAKGWNPDHARALVLELHQEGKRPTEIAAALNGAGLKSKSGGDYTSAAVAAIIRRAEKG
jgi:hypothetical protein